MSAALLSPSARTGSKIALLRHAIVLFHVQAISKRYAEATPSALSRRHGNASLGLVSEQFRYPLPIASLWVPVKPRLFQTRTPHSLLTPGFSARANKNAQRVREEVQYLPEGGKHHLRTRDSYTGFRWNKNHMFCNQNRAWTGGLDLQTSSFIFTRIPCSETTPPILWWILDFILDSFDFFFVGDGRQTGVERL